MYTGWAVARVLGVQSSTVRRAVARFWETGDYRRRSGQGRKRATAPRDDRFLRLTALRTCHFAAKFLKSELLGARHT